MTRTRRLAPGSSRKRSYSREESVRPVAKVRVTAEKKYDHSESRGAATASDLRQAGSGLVAAGLATTRAHLGLAGLGRGLLSFFSLCIVCIDASCGRWLTSCGMPHRTREIHLPPEVVSRQHPTPVSPSQGSNPSGHRGTVVSYTRPLRCSTKSYNPVPDSRGDGPISGTLCLSYEGDREPPRSRIEAVEC